MLKKTLVLAIVIVTIYACKNEVMVPGTTTPTDSTLTGTGTGNPGQTNGLVCFESDVLPIFKSSCAKSGCHDAASHEDGYVLDSYANIMKKDVRAGNADNSKVYKVLIEDDDDRMPKAPNPSLSTAQIQLIKKWINEGANNTTNCSTACDLTVFTYSVAVRSILDANCVGCHNNATTNAGVNLTTYTGVKTVATNGLLIKAITHAPGVTPMPYGGTKLDDCKISKITKWVDAGSPNN